MRICFDLDGTLCYTRKQGERYEDVLPIPGAAETVRQLKAEGHYIIICTARHMKTCNNSLGLIIAKQLKIIIDWLQQHDIPYDELWPGKPLADCYVDDKAASYEGNWTDTLRQIKQKEPQ